MLRLLLFLTALLPLRGIASETRPNLLYILADDLGYGDLSCYGSKDIATPRIDRLAAEGARLTSWYAQPVCTPSRYALLTGRHPNRTEGGLMNALMRAEAADADKGLRSGETTLATLLSGAGYTTSLIGKWHLGHGHRELLPTHHGFGSFFGHTGGCVDFFTLRYGNIPDWYRGDELVDFKGYATDVVTDEAVRFLRAQKTDKPFFLFLAYAAPHYSKGWDASKGALTNVMQAKAESIARMTGIADHNRRIFAAMVVEMDEAVGRVLDTLDAAGLADKTWVVFASDNGGDIDFGASNQPLRGEKNTLYEGGIRVPCIMRWPGRVKPGTVIDQPLIVQDMLPTVCATTGVSTAGLTLDGRDMRPALLHGRPLERDVFFLRKNAASLRRGDWKYLRIDDRDMLFDLTNDLGEQNDLAAQHPEKLATLKAAHKTIADTLSTQKADR